MTKYRESTRMFGKLREVVWKRLSFYKSAKSYYQILMVLCAMCYFFLSIGRAVEKKYGLSSTNSKYKFFLISFFCFSIAVSGISAAATVYVDTDGSGSYNCNGTNDEIEINEALTYIDGLGGGTVYLKGPNTYWIDATLNIGANTILTGDPTAEIKLIANAGWSSDVPMIANIGTDDDITITGFTIDGNSENQDVSLGNGYYNLIYFDNADNIEVSHMRLEWGCGDGLKIRNGENIKFIHNDVYKLGHDALYALACSKVEHAYNTIFIRTNSGCRYSDGCTDSTIHDNLIYSSISGDSTGPAIQIATTSTSNVVFDDIEIYNNRIHTTNGAGVWMSANYQDNVIHARDVYIHHNIFTNVGQYKTNTGYSNAAIILGDFDNTIIENNVFDDGGHAAIKWYLRPDRRQQQTQFTTYVRNNIIMNSDGVSSVTGSGVGIWNTNPTYSEFVVQNNDIYNNKNGQTYGESITMSNNLNVGPQCADSTNSNVNSRDYHLKSEAGRYSNGEWIADSVSSLLIDAGYSGSSFSSEPSPNGGVINIGRYGNTAQASKSVSGNVDNVPVANAGADKIAAVGSTVLFDASASTDDKGIASYSWDFDASNGISSEATGKTVTKTYTTAGTYTVTLTVTDTGGQKATDTVQVIVSSSTNTVSYTPAYDNRLREASPTTVYSTSTYIDIGRSTSTFRDVMLFDLSAYSTTDTISRATLSLYWYYPAGATRTSDTVVEIYRPVEWNQKYVSWNNRASGTPWSTAGGNWYDKNGVSQGSTPYASLTFAGSKVPDNKYYEFDVTELVQEYVNGNYENTGFFLKAKAESGDYIAFYSSDWSNAAQKPILTVTTGSGSVDNLPVANAGADKTATAGSAVTFDASACTDDKGIASYSWDFDASNGITSEATGVSVTHTYTTAGTYTVTLIVTDTGGQKSTDTLQVVVSSSVDNPPVANAGADKTSTAGSAVTFDASASTDDKGIASYSWDFDASNGITSEATGVSVTHTYTTAGTYTVTLIVTDTGGQKCTDTLQVVVSSSTNTVSYTPAYDNRLREVSPTTVYSTSTYIDIGRSTSSSRDVMFFDLNAYKTTDTISRATLSLYWYYPAGATRTSDTVVEIYRPVEWNPKYVSWNNRASGTPWSTAGGNWSDKNGVSQGSTPYASLTFAGSKVPDNKYYEFDVTELVQEYVNGKYENTGFFLKAKTESGNYIAFYSSDWSNAAQKPKLTITC